MSSYAPIVLAFYALCFAALVAFYFKYRELNKKFGSKLAPAGHPYCWYAVVIPCAYSLGSILQIQLETVLSVLSALAGGVWLFFAVRDLRKSTADLKAIQILPATAPVVHEGIPAYGLALKGLNHVYVDLSGIDTKTLVDSKIELDGLKTLVADKLQSAGVEIAPTKSSAKSWLDVRMKTQPGPKQTGSLTTIYLQIGETLTNERLDAINVKVNAPIFTSVTVAVCDGIPSSESISAALCERLDQFLHERST